MRTKSTKTSSPIYRNPASPSILNHARWTSCDSRCHRQSSYSGARYRRIPPGRNRLRCGGEAPMTELIGLASLARTAFGGEDLSPLRGLFLDRVAQNDNDANAPLDLVTLLPPMGNPHFRL